ncbi:MAG: hypothetical protein E7536_10800 [Ruminococcaceae bacterium]|nr:hypothetical protein [Oscillospiraceae bacterium]
MDKRRIKRLNTYGLKPYFTVITFLLLIIFLLPGCFKDTDSDNSVNNNFTTGFNNANNNKEYAKETFYLLRGKDLEINADTEETGYLKCGSCTYYNFDSYAIGSTEKNLFHNAVIICTETKALTWFMYDDNEFSTYIIKDNLALDQHSEPHSITTDEANKDSPQGTYSQDYKWWKDCGISHTQEINGQQYDEWTVKFKSINTDYGNRYIHLETYENRDGSSHLTFSCQEKATWIVLITESFDVNYTESNGDTLFSYNGYIYDVYENGKILTSNTDPTDTINIIYNANNQTLTVTSKLELINGNTSYPVMCSGSYVAVK